MSRRKTKGESKTEAVSVPVTVVSTGWEPAPSGKRAKAMPRPCGKPEVLKTDEVGKKGQGGEFIKRGGQLFRS